MADQPRKESLTAELDAARASLGGYVSVLQHDLDVGERLKSNFARHQAGWFAAAAGLGLLLSRIPRLGRKPIMHAPFVWNAQAEKAGKGALVLTALKFVLNIAKPEIMGLITKKFLNRPASRASGTR